MRGGHDASCSSKKLPSFRTSTTTASKFSELAAPSEFGCAFRLGTKRLRFGKASGAALRARPFGTSRFFLVLRTGLTCAASASTGSTSISDSGCALRDKQKSRSSIPGSRVTSAETCGRQTVAGSGGPGTGCCFMPQRHQSRKMSTGRKARRIRATQRPVKSDIGLSSLTTSNNVKYTVFPVTDTSICSNVGTEATSSCSHDVIASTVTASNARWLLFAIATACSMPRSTGKTMR
mmetsp:Transcript_51968/g.121204  ORF Transcript_51968/g.121204 Transcript_51968/m.121204 type:complete len:235 (-) Transcript_51968:1230-1934(-)